MSNPSVSGPLSHIRVLDLSRIRSGPTCVKQLADFGADVIKIESPSHLGQNGGDGALREGSDFQNLHRNKRSITLNLKEGEGRRIFARLAATTDVVVENYRPDVKHRLGLDYESLREINPRIILVSISGFGQDGPYANRPGFDQIAQGMSGLMSVTGFPETGPMRSGAAIADITAGLHAALGVMTALLERERSGTGQWVHTSLLMSGIALLDFQAARYLIKGEIPQMSGNDHPSSMPTSAYKTADGHMNIGAYGEDIWIRLCNVIERPDLLNDDRFTTDPLRVRHKGALNETLQTTFQQKKTQQWIDILNQAGVPCGPIYKMDEVFADPQVQHLKAAQTVTHPQYGDLKLVNQAVTLSRTPASLNSATPALGQHTTEVLLGVGFTHAQIDEFRAKNVV
ncbi:MAG: CoA transferase [Betaproteobacteria bacterium]|nr:CoA transferase [Betaproteobacteria bacterium]